jgi:Ca-activated chloride channel family protein
MSFGNPLLLLTLLALPAAVAAYVYLERRPVRYAMTFTNLDVLASVARGRSIRRYIPPAVARLALGALCVALARPHQSTLVASDRSTVVLVIDVSGSMRATDVKPSRLGAAQAAVRKFLDQVPSQVRVALVAFAGDPQVAAPPTKDRQLVLQALDTLDYFSGFGGTAIGDALATAVQLVKPPTPQGAQTIAYTIATKTKSPISILFLSDGHQTRGLLQPLEGAARARNAGIPVYTIALGTPNGVLDQGNVPGGGGFRGGGGGGGGFGPQRIPVPPDPVTLRQIARLTGGKFFAARSSTALESAYKNLGSLVAREPGKKEITNEFVLLGAGLLLAAGLLSALYSPRLP